MTSERDDRLLSALVEAIAFHGFDRACEVDALDMAYALIDRCPEPDGPGLGETVARIRDEAVAAARAEWDEREQKNRLLRAVEALEEREAAQRALVERIEAACYAVESQHHIHGEQCLCGFESSRARSRTEHLTGFIRAALAADPSPSEERLCGLRERIGALVADISRGPDYKERRSWFARELLAVLAADLAPSQSQDPGAGVSRGPCLNSSSTAPASASPSEERALPAVLRSEAQRRTEHGYVHHATVRALMHRLADHMDAMAEFGSGDCDLPSPSEGGAEEREVDGTVTHPPEGVQALLAALQRSVDAAKAARKAEEREVCEHEFEARSTMGDPYESCDKCGAIRDLPHASRPAPTEGDA